MSLKSLPNGTFAICRAEGSYGRGGGETRGARRASLGRLKSKIGQVRSQIALIAITVFVIVLIVEFFWMPTGTSITKLNDSGTYGGVALTTLLFAYLAITLRNAHRYASRLTLIVMVGLVVLLVGWGLKSV